MRTRLLLTMFPPMSGRYRLGGLHRLRYASRREPSVAHLLLAGLAVFAFAKLMSAANRGHRSRPTALTIGILLLVVGALVMSLRRSARRYSR